MELKFIEKVNTHSSDIASRARSKVIKTIIIAIIMDTYILCVIYDIVCI
jgi:hypothetical protein